jgi:hypothetical protein
MSGMSPLNYGNYYMGNTTMQMMPFMMKKVAKYAQRQAMASMGGGGGGGFMPMMPMMPMMPCMPASCAMPMAAPMMAAVTPLPIAFNPLVQGMYPMASMSSGNCMTPASFMSAMNTGPMAYRPPPSFEFPSNVGMVMTLPYGSPNPLFSTPTFGGFSPQYNMGSGLSCCCCYCAPQCAPPAITYCPRPVSVPQPYPVPYPVPVPVPNIQQVPVPRQVSVVAPPIFAGGNQGFSVPAGAPLMQSQGMFTQGGLGQSMVMASHHQSTTSSLLSDHSSESSKRSTPIPNSIDPARRAKAQRIAASLSNLGLNNNERTRTTPSKAKNRLKTSHTHDDIPSRFRHRLSSTPHLSRSNHDLTIVTSKSDSSISNFDRLRKSSTMSKTKQKRPLTNEKSIHQSSRSHRHRNSSVSEHDLLVSRQKCVASRSRKNSNPSVLNSHSRHLLTNDLTSSKYGHSKKRQQQATNKTIDEE